MTMLVELFQDGPMSEAELVRRETWQAPTEQTLVSLEPTAFLLDCSRLWRQHFGSRFHLYKTRSDKGQKRQRRPGTLNHLRQQQSASADTLVRRAKSRGRDHATIFDGLVRKDLPRPFNQNLKKIAKKKAQRKDRATALELRRRTRIRECPFVAGPLRRTTMFTKRSEAALVADRRYLHKQTLRMVDTRSTGTALERLHEKQNFQVWRTTSFSSPAEVLRQLRKTDIVLLEKETHWQQEPREPSSSTQDFPLLLWTLSMTTVHRTQ